MAFIEQPDSLYNKTLIAYIVNLIPRDPFRKNMFKILNAGLVYDYERRFFISERYIRKEINREDEMKKIIEEVENLNLPLNIKKDIKNRFFPVCFEIKAWMEHYRNISLSQCYDLDKILDCLCWTCTGVINADKTWKKIVINGLVDDNIFYKYRYACLNCWEENIRILWRRLPRINDDMLKYSELNGSKRNLVTFWNFYMSNKLNELIGNDGCSENLFGLNTAMRQGNASVIKYFWNKLTPEEKKNNLIKCFENSIPSCPRVYFYEFMNRSPRSTNISNLYFFLKQLSNEQARIIFNNSNTDLCSILSCFTDFSFRTLFLPIMEYILKFTEISQVHYTLLLKKIASELIGDPKTYSHLFKYIWEYKIHDKNEAVMSSNWWTIVKVLLETESYENVLLIFDNISVKTREKFFRNRGIHIFCKLNHQNKFNIFEGFMGICLSNKYAALRFKNYYEKVKDRRRTIQKLKINTRIQFINTVDRFIMSFDR